MQIAGFSITRARQANKPERRSTLGAPAKWLIDALTAALTGGKNTSGQSVNPDTALSLAAVHSCIRVKADSIATMPLKLYSTAGGARFIDNNHPLSYVLNEPNPIQTRYDWLKWCSAQIDLSGNAFTKIYRDPFTAQVTELEPIHHTRVTVKVIDEEVFYHLKGEDEAGLIPAFDMLHFKGLCYDTTALGKSPITMHAQSLGINMAAEAATGKFYGKSASLKWIIKHGGGAMDKQQADRLKESFNNVLDGEDPATILPAGSELQALNLSPEQAQFIAERQYGAKDIARIFGVPGYMIGADDGGVKSSVEQQAQDFYVQTIMPLVVMMEQEMKRKLLREDEKGTYYFKFQFNSLLRADSKSRGEFYNLGIRGGWLSPNDARRFEDMDLLTDGDTTYTESNLVPSDMMKPWIQSKIDAAPSAQVQTNNPNGNN